MSTPRNSGSTPLRVRRIARVATALGFAVMASTLTFITACGDSPSAPLALRDAAPANAKTSPITTGSTTGVTTRVTPLLRDVPLATTQTRSWTIKRALGGTMEWPELGLKVVVPARAFRSNSMTLTVTALAGDLVAYDFGPDGSVFLEPLTVTQSLKGTNYSKLGGNARLRGGYFRSAMQLNDATNQADVDEFEPTDVDLTGWKLTFKVTHFSGYMVSTD